MASQFFSFIKSTILIVNLFPVKYVFRCKSVKSGEDKLTQNLSAVLNKVNEIKLEKRPIPTITPNQVLIQMEVVGICGSDVRYWQHGKVGPFVLKKPMVLGHEGAGTILKCGENVKNLVIGDKVAIEPGIPCRSCEYCKTSRYHLCPDIMFAATPPNDGNLSRFYCTDADFCYKLPCEVSLEEGALCEPLAIGVHANKLAKVRMGSVCVVQGAGPVGLATAVTAKAFGARKVLITDVADYRLDMARKIGAADFTLNTDTMEEMDIAYRIIELLEEEPHATFECAGKVICARLGLHITKSGGYVVLLGMGADEMSLPFVSSSIKEITIISSFRYANDYQDAVELFKSKKINLLPIATHHFSLEETLKAYETHREQVGNPIKILIHCNPKWKPKSKC